MEKLRIVVLEDNPFYNRMFSEKLQLYMETLAAVYPLRFEIESYTEVEECLENLKLDTDILYIDYYLDSGQTASRIIQKIMYRCPECEVVVMSQFYSISNYLVAMLEGASCFIQKGIQAIPRSCKIIRQLIERRIQYGF
jgi:DNA-binding NtrC family response regulator